MTNSEHERLTMAQIDDRLITACLKKLFADSEDGLIEAVRSNSEAITIKRQTGSGAF